VHVEVFPGIYLKDGWILHSLTLLLHRDLSSLPPLTTTSISLELLQDCLGTLEQLTTGITNLGVDATEDPTQAPRVRVLLEELLMSLQQCVNDLEIYPPSPFDL